MKVYFTFRNHFKTIQVIHLGINISCCFDSFACGISLSLLFITVGFHIYKSKDNAKDKRV